MKTMLPPPPTTIDANATYTVEEAAGRMRLSAHTISRMIKRGELDAVRQGSRLTITEAAIREYYRVHEVTRSRRPLPIGAVWRREPLRVQ